MKKNWHLLITFGVFIFVALGCSAINKIQKEVEKTQATQVLTSTDNCCQITVPGTWRTETVLNNAATLQASNRLGEEYIVVIRESRQDFGKAVNLDLVTNAVRDNLRKTLSDPVFSDPVSANVNGYPAKQFEISGEAQNIKAKYLYAIVETPQNYYQIITWSLVSRFDENRPQLLEVINSFKEISGSANTAPAIPKPSVK